MKDRIRIQYCPLLYIALMGISNLIVSKYFHASYGTPQYVEKMLPFIAVLAAFACFCFFRKRAELPLSWPEKPRYAVYLLLFLPLVAMTLFFVFKNGRMDRAFLIPLAVTLLVGLGEELMFRRLLFVGLLGEMEFRRALLFSSIVFSLLHSVNVFAGFPFSQMLLQLVTTFLAGLYYALMYYYTKNIGIIIIGHGLWDYLLLGGATKTVPAIGVAMTVMTALELLVTIFVLRKTLRTPYA